MELSRCDLNRMESLPGPKGLKLLQLGLMFQKNPLDALDYMHTTWGDIVFCPWPNRNCIFIFDPLMIRHVLKDNQLNYLKSSEYSHMKPLLGEGLLTSEGEKWKNQRRLMAGEFHPESIESYLNPMKKIIEENMERLQVDSYTDISEFFSRITFSIAGEIFFGAKVESFSDEVKQALEFEMERINKRIRRAWNFPTSFPTPENVKGKKAVGTLNKVVGEILDNEKGSTDNILFKLQSKTPALDKQVIRDEVMTLLLAGHETTSNTLTWTMWFLCQHPEWQLKLREELATLGKKPSEMSLADLTNLRAFRVFLLESMRLRPAIPTISRKTIAKDQLGAYEIPSGVSVQIVPYVTHRDERFWPDSKKFQPERFVHRPDKRDDFTYLPFARGARSCIGEGLAMAEATLILAYLIESFIWEIEPGFEPQLVHNLTLRSDNGLSVMAKKL
jgi:cytochrome P450